MLIVQLSGQLREPCHAQGVSEEALVSVGHKGLLACLASRDASVGSPTLSMSYGGCSLV